VQKKSGNGAIAYRLIFPLVVITLLWDMCNNVLEMWQKQGKEKLFIVRKLENTCVKR